MIRNQVAAAQVTKALIAKRSVENVQSVSLSAPRPPLKPYASLAEHAQSVSTAQALLCAVVWMAVNLVPERLAAQFVIALALHVGSYFARFLKKRASVFVFVHKK